MQYFREDFVDQRRKQWLRAIVAVEVQVDGKWYRGSIDQKKIEGDTLVIMATFPVLDSITCTITASRIIDVRGKEGSYQQRTIEKVKGQGTMIKLTIPIYEVTA